MEILSDLDIHGSSRAFLLLAASFAVGLWLTTRIQMQLCPRVDRLDATIIDTLQRSEKALPANPYFRTHPKELARSLREIRREVTAFQGNVC